MEITILRAKLTVFSEQLRTGILFGLDLIFGDLGVKTHDPLTSNSNPIDIPFTNQEHRLRYNSPTTGHFMVG